jgi:ABC-2 type transport system ATP-binding protein
VDTSPPARATPIVEAVGLTKHFGKVRALDGLDLVAPSGEVLAILGPNGAGKTTFVRSVATLLRPTSGTLRVAGVDAVRHPERVRRMIGLAGQSASVEEALTGAENLQLVARLFGHDRRTARRSAQVVLEQLGLADAGDRLVRTYSGGMRRRLDLGASLVGSPKLLLLDEPTTGLDPRSRLELWDAIRELVASGTDVLLTTQYLDEADQLAHMIVIVDHGRVIASGTPAELKSRAGGEVVELRPRDPADLGRAAAVVAGLGTDQARVDGPGRRITIPVDHGTERLTDAVRLLDEHAIALDDVALRRPTLDEVFLHLTGHTAEPRDDDRGDHTRHTRHTPHSDDTHHTDDRDRPEEVRA